MSNEEINSKKNQTKAINKLITFCTIILLIILGMFCSFIRSLFITPDTVQKILLDCFNTEQKNSVMQDYGNGYTVICINESDINQAMLKLKLAYTKLGKKFESKKLDKLDVIVNDTYSNNQILISTIWVKDLKETDWKEIKTYEDFIKQANISIK